MPNSYSKKLQCCCKKKRLIGSLFLVSSVIGVPAWPLPQDQRSIALHALSNIRLLPARVARRLNLTTIWHTRRSMTRLPAGSSSGRPRGRPCPPSASATPDLGWGRRCQTCVKALRGAGHPRFSNRNGRGGGRDRGQGRRGCRQRCGLAQWRAASAPSWRMLKSHIDSAGEKHSHRFASARWGCRPSTRCAVAERGDSAPARRTVELPCMGDADARRARGLAPARRYARDT